MNRSRFKNVRDYFLRRDDVAAKMLKWLGLATPKASEQSMKEYLSAAYVAPARDVDATAWDELNMGNSVYVWRSDGSRLHAAVMPLDNVPEGVKTNEGRVPFDMLFRNVDTKPKRAVTLTVKHLKDAIAHGAERVTLLIPTEGDSTLPIEVASIENDAQIGYAVLVPGTQEWGRNAQDWRVRRPDFRPFNDILSQLEEEGNQEAAEKEARREALEAMLAEVDEHFADAEGADLADWQELSPEYSQPMFGLEVRP